MNLQDRYAKFSAGPFDNKFMHSIESEFERQKWFRVEKINNKGFLRSIYVPLSKSNDYKKYYQAYFGELQNSIGRIIDLFRVKSTAFSEISATLFACYLEIQSDKSVLNQQELLRRFYGWAKSKKQYNQETVLENLSWLRGHGLITL